MILLSASSSTTNESVGNWACVSSLRYFAVNGMANYIFNLSSSSPSSFPFFPLLSSCVFCFLLLLAIHHSSSVFIFFPPSSFFQVLHTLNHRLSSNSESYLSFRFPLSLFLILFCFLFFYLLVLCVWMEIHLTVWLSKLSDRNSVAWLNRTDDLLLPLFFYSLFLVSPLFRLPSACFCFLIFKDKRESGHVFCNILWTRNIPFLFTLWDVSSLFFSGIDNERKLIYFFLFSKWFQVWYLHIHLTPFLYI